MSQHVNRRRFLKTSTAVGVGFWAAGGVAAQESKSPNERIRFASVGIGGKGSSDSGDANGSGDMVAICDVDDKTLAAGTKRFPKARAFFDFRKMLEEMDKSIDAVTVSTPDHCHAAASVMAMRLGKHCFTQKPLTHSLFEARTMGEVAREKKVATSMGNQGTAERGLREAAAIMKSGGLGKVSEVHVWTNRPIWPQGGERPKEATPPSNVHWDEWIGPAPMRPYGNGYHPFAWRGWWDFGTGALGDMACHTLNMPFAGLDLRDPISVQAVTSGHNKDSYPKWSIITFEFGANEKRGPVTFKWYDGGKRPDRALIDGKNPSGSGCVVIGDKAKIYSPNDYAAEFEMLGAAKPKVEIVQSPGHFQEWVRAIKGGQAAMANFADYAGPLTETILLGNLAVWAAPEKEVPGKKIDWDAKNLKAKNAPEVDHIIKTEYRKGYTL